MPNPAPPPRKDPRTAVLLELSELTGEARMIAAVADRFAAVLPQEVLVWLMASALACGDFAEDLQERLAKMEETV